MRYLFDTNALSALRRRDQLDEQTRRNLTSLPEKDCFVSVIVIAELEQGILRLARRDRLQANVLREWFEKTVESFAPERILDVDLSVAMACAALHVPNPRPKHDALIAATALVHDLTLVTRNVPDFRDIEGLHILDPWGA